MSSRKFAFVLLSTTFLGFLSGLPMAAAAKDLTLSDETITKAQSELNNKFTITDDQNVNIEKNTNLSSGELIIDADGSANSVITGTLFVVPDHEKQATLTVQNVGNTIFPEGETEEFDWSQWNSTNTHGWVNGPNGTEEAAIEAYNADVTVDNSIFANSSNTRTSDDNPYSGAIYVGEGAQLESKKSIFYNNKAALNGGAVAIDSSRNNSFDDNYFVKNKADKFGGALGILGNVDSINRSVFVENTAGIDGGAISVDFVSDTGVQGTVQEITDSTFLQNQAANGGGGAIYNNGFIKDIIDTKFNGNTAINGGAIYNEKNIEGISSKKNAGNVSGTNIFFTGNIATGSGGAIYNKGTIGSITDVTFEKNEARGTTGNGGAIYVDKNGAINSIDNVTFNENKAANGGAVSVGQGASVTITKSHFTENTATATSEEHTGAGGAIFAYTDSNLNTEGNKFDGNKVLGDASVAGGAVHNDNGTWISVNDTFTGNSSSTDGGAIGSNGNTTLTNATITGNTAADRGGGIVARNSNGTAQTNINGGTISQNTAAVGGGLANVNLGSEFANTSNVTVSGTEISGNQAIENGSNAQSGHGGGIYNEQILTVSNATVSNNTAVSGAGIYNAQGGTATIDGTTAVSGNTASGNGGGVYNNGQLTVNGSGTGVTVSGNNAVDGAGIYNDQGGVAVIDGNTTISGNTASGNGGGIYNNGQLTVKGSGVTIKGNNAVLGQNLYNDENGIVNIENADDQIDLNYVPYTNTPKPQDDLHTLFDQTQDIYNAGTMNITDSNLQLHQGINTSSTLTDDAQRKVGTVNITGSTVDLGGSNVLGAGVMYGNQVNINANSTIKTHISTENDGLHGRISAHDINVSDDNTNLNVTVGVGELQQGESREYQILQGDKVTGEFHALGNNKSYDMEALGNGNYKIYRKANYCPGCDVNENNTNNGWLDQKIDPSQNSDAADIQNQLNEASQYGNPHQREALDGLAPDVSPLVQAHATEITQRLASIVNDRFYESMERTGYIHRGKRFYRFPRHDSNLWVQGLYGKSKYDVRKGWDMDNRGISVGFDGHVNDAVRLGIAYAYTKSSGESVQRDTDIKSHTGMIYGNYNPNRFYANWLAMYTRSKYDEDKKVFNHNVKASYDVDAFGAQLMLGRKMGPYVSDDWATGVIKPEIGARYVYTKQHAYTDTVGQSVGSSDGNTLTGILGAQYTIGYALSPTLSWYPELRAALTYDFVEPDTKMRVNLLNGSVYEVKTENMDRFGIEVGARIGLDINRKAEVALEYEGLFKGDYTNHTGLANLKYKF